MADQPRVSHFQWRNTFAALRHRNFRLWFWGQMVSLFGTWMQIAAQGYLIFQLTGSPAYLGYVGFSSGAAVWLFMLYGGVIADRVPRRSLLLATQSYMTVLALVLAALTFFRVVQPWHILVLAFLLGLGNALDAPARQAFVLEMVEREDLTNAIALNSTMFNTGMVVGPAAGGLIYAAVGPGWCFSINAVTFLAVIAALALMRLPPRAPRPAARTAQRNPFPELGEGLRYTFGHPFLRTFLLLAAGIGLFGISFATLFPAWAVRVLGGDATTNGLLQSARGLGGLAGALGIASLGQFRFRGKLVTAGSFLFPLALFGFAFMRRLPPALLFSAVAGAASLITLNLTNALLQTTADDLFRGRVMSLYSLCIFGLNPIGALLAGTAAQAFGEPAVLIVGAGSLLAIAAGVYLGEPRLRRAV
jgi:MFS family permease